MTLDEAIKHCEEVIKNNYELADAFHTDEGVYLEKETICRNCAEDHEQLLGWLKELREYKENLGKCGDCKYFEYDVVANVDGIPLIVAHEMCRRWGDGCKRKENGFCFLFEKRE